ncbi:MAG: LIC_13387 family protein [Candidatus Sulfotelmatobacter sp.]
MADKWGRRLFTAGGVVLVLLGLVHSLSLIGKPVPANDTERQLLDLMANYKFNVMGSMRTMDNFLRGFSIAFLLGAVSVGALDLALCRERAGLLKRVALVNVVWLAAMTAVSLRYFFIFPTTFLVTALLIFALAWLNLLSRGES